MPDSGFRSGIPLRCPACHQGHLLEQSKSLRCKACNADFPCLPSGACELLEELSGDEAAQRDVYDELRSGHWASTDPFHSFTTLTGIRFTQMLRKLQLAPDSRVLEVGCASGPVMASLEANYGARVFGIDVSIASIDMQLRRRAADAAYDAICASALDLPFDDGTFDAVVSFDVIEHLEQPEQFYDEVARVLKPGGKALIRGAVIDFALTVDWLRYYLDHNRWMARMKQAGHFYKNFRSKREHAVYARNAGLKVARITGSDLFWENLFDYYVLPFLFGLVRKRSPVATSAAVQETPPLLKLKRPNSAVHRLWRAWLRFASWVLWPEKVMSRLGFGASAYLELQKPVPPL